MLKPLRNESVLELNIRAHYIAMEPTPVVEPIPAGEPTPEAEPNLAVEPALKIDPNPVVPILAHMTVTPFPIPTPAKSGIKTSLMYNLRFCRFRLSPGGISGEAHNCFLGMS